MQILLPTREDVLLMHDLILAASSGRAGILHDHQIDAALQRPHTYMQYSELDVHTLAALLIDSFGRNHAFNDGNKRTALMSAIYTYAINGVFLEFDTQMNQEFEELVLWVVKEKPEIEVIRARLLQLVAKYKLGTFNSFIKSFRDFFTQ